MCVSYRFLVGRTSGGTSCAGAYKSTLYVIDTDIKNAQKIGEIHVFCSLKFADTCGYVRYEQKKWHLKNHYYYMGKISLIAVDKVTPA